MKTIAIGTNENEQVLVHVHGYGFEKAGNPYDDYLEVEVAARIGGLSANYPGVMLAIELDRFATQIRELYDTLKGSISLKTLESHLDLEFSVDRTGHIQISGELREDPHYINNLTFELTFDQTQFEGTVRSVEAARQAFPRRT
jgi:hypothetical protein